MMIFGIGIDVVEVSRVESAFTDFSNTFRNRIFTAAEQDYCDKQKRPALHYAARFAAKEAISKSLGTGIGAGASWLDIEILRMDTGAPRVCFTGNAAKFVSTNHIVDVQISITHAKDYAAANAVAICKSK